MSDLPTGTLFGVGLGPGDPELVTVKARRVIEAAEVVAYPTAQHGRSVARRIAAPYLREDQIEVALAFPVTTGTTDHPDGYDAALREFYDRAAAQLAAHLDAGRDVAVLCSGDPFLYGSYMYLHERLAERYPTEVVPGVTSFSAAAAAAGTPLAKRDDVLTVLPGTLAPDALATRLRATDAAVVLKLGGGFETVREAAERAGLAERGIYVERASSTEQRTMPLREVEGEVPYMSLVLVPSASDRDRAGRRGSSGDRDRGAPAHSTAGVRGGHRAGSLAVVGLGPAGPQWLTAEASAALADAEELVGYGSYLARVPVRPGQRRHASDNRAEAERAREALELAAGGARVAVVSSGDPGIFAMATAVLEALDERPTRLSGVDLRVVPGVSAMQAAAARVGAPLGHDFCVISLSDRLKPWSTIERRLEAAGSADLALALYNPASRTRRAQLEEARTILLRHRDPETPVVVARAVGSDEESVTVATLAGFAADGVDMRTLLIIGSSTTRLIEDDGVRRVYTPRRYPA